MFGADGKFCGFPEYVIILKENQWGNFFWNVIMLGKEFFEFDRSFTTPHATLEKVFPKVLQVNNKLQS